MRYASASICLTGTASAGAIGECSAPKSCQACTAHSAAPARAAAWNAYPNACSLAVDPSKPTTTGPAVSPCPCTTTTTGHEACWVTAALVEPSNILVKPPNPRDPTTSSRACCASASNVARGSPVNRCTCV